MIYLPALHRRPAFGLNGQVGERQNADDLYGTIGQGTRRTARDPSAGDVVGVLVVKAESMLIVMTSRTLVEGPMLSATAYGNIAVCDHADEPVFFRYGRALTRSRSSTGAAGWSGWAERLARRGRSLRSLALWPLE